MGASLDEKKHTTTKPDRSFSAYDIAKKASKKTNPHLPSTKQMKTSTDRQVNQPVVMPPAISTATSAATSPTKPSEAVVPINQPTLSLDHVLRRAEQTANDPSTKPEIKTAIEGTLKYKSDLQNSIDLYNNSNQGESTQYLRRTGIVIEQGGSELAARTFGIIYARERSGDNNGLFDKINGTVPTGVKDGNNISDPTSNCYKSMKSFEMRNAFYNRNGVSDTNTQHYLSIASRFDVDAIDSIRTKLLTGSNKQDATNWNVISSELKNKDKGLANKVDLAIGASEGMFR